MIMLDTSPLDAALGYARRGWRVVPIVRGQKRPPMDRWQEVATVDEVLIRQWFDRWPGHGVGIATGARSGIFVLDVDVSDGKKGDDTLADLEATYGALPSTVEVVTGSGGRHLYFQWPADVTVTNDAGKRLGPGLDVRGEGGQVVAPPTVHPNGSRYAWEASSEPDTAVVAEAPDWLLRLLTATPDITEARVERSPRPDSDLRPGDLFAAANSWRDLLVADGATFLGTRTDHKTGTAYELWARPGVDHASATLYYGGTDLLKVFSSNWPGLVEGDTYTKFGYWTARKHDGDHRAAAKALRDEGYALPEPSVDWAQQATPETGVGEPETRHRFVPGGTFILDVPDQVPAIWGADEHVLWAQGEGLILAGPPGVGKTTLAGQVLFARLGLIDDVLGYPVTVTSGKVLYLASDRPQQIQRSFRRLADESQRAVLDERLVVWRGPPPADLAKQPELLGALVGAAGADTVFLDSLKDMAIGISDDEVGAGLNNAMQRALADGIEVAALHHQRKGQAGTKPKTLEDLYGSTWLAAGAGSVIVLWGQAGDAIVELIHLKQPSTPIGPLKIEHDHHAGTTVVTRGFDALAWLRRQPRGGTAKDAARSKFERQEPTENQIRATRRELERLVRMGLATREEGTKNDDGRMVSARYFATESRFVDLIDSGRIDLTDRQKQPEADASHEQAPQVRPTTTPDGHHDHPNGQEDGQPQPSETKDQVKPTTTPTDTTTTATDSEPPLSKERGAGEPDEPAPLPVQPSRQSWLWADPGGAP